MYLTGYFRRLFGLQFKQRVLFFLEQNLKRMFGPSFAKLYVRQVKVSKRFNKIRISLVVVDIEPFNSLNVLGLAKLTVLQQKLSNFFELPCVITIKQSKDVFKI